MTDVLHEYRTMDKSKWGDGEWQQEPDKIQWIDSETGLDCLMVRNHSGAWCGYVGVDESHPDFNKSYDDLDVEVHGGLTYGDFCDERAEEGHGICHIPEPGRPAKVWWLGFDCAHSSDLIPSMRAMERERGWTPIEMPGYHDVYRNRQYVEQEVAGLARQLRDRSQVQAS